MKVSNPNQLSVLLRSVLRQIAERSNVFFQELVPFVQEREVKVAVESRVFISGKITETLVQCFTPAGEKPAPLGGRFLGMSVGDFREQLGEIQSLEVRLLFNKPEGNTRLRHRNGEFMALIAAFEAAGQLYLCALLESRLADELAFAERVRRLIQRRREKTKAAARLRL